jgi:ribosomal protein S18 acetylase RimI-like enzyme
MKFQQFRKLDNINRLAKIIFLNFIKLMDQPNIEFSMDAIERLLVSNNLVGWFLLDNNDKIIGYLVGEIQRLHDGRLVYFISYFYISKNYRGKGLGKIMLLRCLKFIKDNNIPFTMLITERDTVGYNLYRKIGFQNDPLIKIDNPDYVLLMNYTT